MAIAFVRALKVGSPQYLTMQRRHAHRTDTTSEVRPGAVPGTALVWIPSHMPEGGDPRDYRALYQCSKVRRGFSERKGAAIALHLLAGVSPCWIKAGGGLHDPENPRNQMLRDEAVAWVKSWAGDDSVIGARLDLDEAGGGVVDVFCVPTAVQRHKSGSTKLTVSVNKTLAKLQADHEATYSYEALQTSWHAWAKEHLDPKLKRGEPAHKTSRVHLRIGEYKREQDHRKAEEALRIEREELARGEAVLAEQERLNKEAATELERKAATLMQAQKEVFQAAVSILSEPDLRAVRLPLREGDQRPFDAPQFEAQRSLIMQARPLWPVMNRFLEAVREKHRLVDRQIAELHMLRDEVDDHLRERIEQIADEAAASSSFGCP